MKRFLIFTGSIAVPIEAGREKKKEEAARSGGGPPPLQCNDTPMEMEKIKGRAKASASWARLIHRQAPLKIFRGQAVRQESWQEIESESLLLGKAVTTRRVPES